MAKNAPSISHSVAEWVASNSFRCPYCHFDLEVNTFPSNSEVWGSLLEKGNAPGRMGGMRI